MTLRDRLIDLIRTMPEEELEALAPKLARYFPGEATSWQDSLERARSFRARMKKRYGTMPDSVETLRQIREERLDDILGLH